MNDPERLTLTNGALRFSALAMGKGSVVFLLHGFPDSNETFRTQIIALAEAGYRAVAPAMRGYEPSSQAADSDYHVVRMAEDVVAWADQLGAAQFHVVGHDWGATVGFAVAGLAPSRVASLTAIAVPHPVRFSQAYMSDPAQQARSTYIHEFQSPDADAVIVADDCAFLEALWTRWSPSWAIPTEALAEMRRVFTATGVAAGTLNWYRQAFDVGSEAGRATQQLLAGPFVAPTLGICGADDGCIGANIFVGAMQGADFPRALSVRCIESAGHFVHREAAAPVNALLIDWLAKHPAAGDRETALSPR